MKDNEYSKNMDVYEASDYWDEHDFGDFNDIQEVKEMQFILKKKKYVGIDMELYAIIKTKADSLNISEDSLINKWLSEKASP